MRPRKKDKHLPPCVYYRSGAFYLVRRGKWQRLGADLSTALAEYGRRLEAPKGGMAALIEEALPIITKNVAKSTADQYAVAARKLSGMLAEFAPEQVQQRHVAQIRRSLDSTPNMANRCLTVLRLVFSYAVEQQVIDNNPATGIKRLEEAKRERLIARDEYTRIYNAAPPRLQVIMDLLYLTGQRVMDVVKIRRNDITEAGIYFRQGKTGARLLVAWSPELRAVVERAKGLCGNVKALTLLHNRRGKAPDYKTVYEQWTAACSRAGVPDADMRDLRAMSGTATEEQGKNPTALLGHTSPTMTKRYLRSKKVPTVEGPSFGQPLDIGQKTAKK